MIYSLLVFLYVLLNISRNNGYFISNRRIFKHYSTLDVEERNYRSLHLLDVNQYYKEPVPVIAGSRDNSSDDIVASNDLITVRFINTISGKDVIASDIEMGANLLAVGDKLGVKLPRACRTGSLLSHQLSTEPHCEITVLSRRIMWLLFM